MGYSSLFAWSSQSAGIGCSGCQFPRTKFNIDIVSHFWKNRIVILEFTVVVVSLSQC